MSDIDWEQEHIWAMTALAGGAEGDAVEGWLRCAKAGMEMERTRAGRHRSSSPDRDDEVRRLLRLALDSDNRESGFQHVADALRLMEAAQSCDAAATDLR